jgi:hypothetical protein
LRELAAEPVRIGPKQREVQALDSSTIARFRAVRKLGAAGKGYWGRAGKAVRANIVATINSVVLVGGIRMGIVRRTRLRRWSAFHFEEQAATILDVVRVDDPKYDKPLLIGGTARELSTTEYLFGYQCRSTIETNFFVAQDTAAMEMPRAFAETAVTRRINLALLSGSLLKAIAAKCEPLSLGPWDNKPKRTAGRLAHYLHQHVEKFKALALRNTTQSRSFTRLPSSAFAACKLRGADWADCASRWTILLTLRSIKTPPGSGLLGEPGKLKTSRVVFCVTGWRRRMY